MQQTTYQMQAQAAGRRLSREQVALPLMSQHPRAGRGHVEGLLRTYGLVRWSSAFGAVTISLPSRVSLPLAQGE